MYNNPYLFTGRRYDHETGLYYYRARHYNPAIGRFMQADPIHYAAGLNLYTYCGNNPINWIDPWGLCKVESKILTSEEFERRIEPTVRRILRRSRWGGFWPPNYYYMTDSDFAWDYQRYNYMGTVVTGEEINYYLQGILQEHYRWGPGAVITLPWLHNVLMHGHQPSTYEYVFTQLGCWEYEDWKKKQRK